MRLVLLGPPGSGKGTQGARLAAHYGVPQLGSGILIRDHIARRTAFGRKIAAAIAAGNFASDEDILYWMRRRMAKADAAGGYVLDGFPRGVAQAEAFDRELEEQAASLIAVVLDVPEPVLVERLAGRLVCGECHRTYHAEYHPSAVEGRCDTDGARLVRRPEDDAATVPRRMEIYAAVTRDVAEYYRRSGRLASVDGDASEGDVFERIRQAVEAHRS